MPTKRIRLRGLFFAAVTEEIWLLRRSLVSAEVEQSLNWRDPEGESETV